MPTHKANESMWFQENYYGHFRTSIQNTSGIPSINFGQNGLLTLSNLCTAFGQYISLLARRDPKNSSDGVL